MTGTIDVLRMKPASDMLRLSARFSGCSPVLELVGVEAVDHLVLADARPDRRELLEVRVEGDQAEQVLEEHRRHADGADRRARSPRRSARRRRRSASTASASATATTVPCSAARSRGRSAG